MKEYSIYRGDEAIYEFVVDDTISKSLSGNKYVSFTISSKDELDLKIGDYVLVGNEKYEIFEPIDIEESNGVFTYPLTLYFQGYKLNNSIITDEGATTFQYHGEVSDFMILLISSLNVDYPEFLLGEIENGSILDLSFDNSNCMAALQTVCENAEMEWDITGTTITVKRRIGEETDHVFEYGKNKGSYSVKLSKVANASVTTRMIGKGGAINLPANYVSPDSPKRLNLGDEVLEKNVDKYGKITGVYVNENIYPRLINKTVLGVTVPENIEEAGSWKIKLDIPFNLSDYYAENEVPVVKFQTGDLTGLDFEIVENSWNNTDKTLSIIVKEEEDGYYIPNENRQPRVGDVFVLLNINMPQSYIDEATQELREATQNELNKKCEPQYAPSLSVQKHYIKKKGISLNIGDGITVKIGSRRITTRIIGLTETSDDIRVELGDQMLYTYDTKVNNTIEQIQFTLKQLINIDDIKRLFYNLINAWYPKWFNQKLHKDADVEFNSVKVADIVQSDNISSHDFTSGPLGSGHRIKDGNAEFQNVTVRGSISAFEYLIQQVKAVGGKLLVSGASMKVGAVEELEDGYKCSFNTDGGTIYNTFIADDQAFHQVYNGQKKSRYWRLVTEIGSDYIVLSKTDCEAGSDVPQVGDEILQLGNRTDINRMSAIMLSAYDENSPYTAYYNGINSFSLVGKETMREGNLNGIVDNDFGQLAGFGMFADNVYLKGQFWLMSGKTVEQSIGEVQSNIDNLQIGTENLISWKMMLEWNKKNKDIAVYGQDADGVYLGVNQELLYLNVSESSSIFKPIFDITFKPNTQYVFSVEWKLAGAQDYDGLWFRIFYTDGTTTGVIIEKDQTTKKISTIITEAGKTVSKISASYGIGEYRTFIYNISLIEGNKPLQGFPVATDDLPNNINLVNGTKEMVLEDTGTTHNFKTLSIPVIKPNTAYYISFNTEFLAGSSEKFTTNIWDKAVKNFLCYNNITTKQGGVIITKNDFTEQSGSLLIYAGIAGYTQGNSVKYTDIMLVEGRFPATAWTPSVNEQMNSIKTEVSAEIKAESDKINLSVSEKIANTREYTDDKTYKSYLINTSSLDPNKYYPVTIGLHQCINVRIEVMHDLNGMYIPPWGTHPFGFSLICKWTTNGNGWGSIPIGRTIDEFEYDWSSVIPVGNIGQMNKSNDEFIYVRGGSAYEFKVYSGGIEPILHTEPFTVYGDTIYILDSVDKPVPFKKETRASIEVLKDQINLKVSNGDIINQINLSTEGVRIKGSRIELDGTTIFKKGEETIQIFGSGDDVFSINNGVFRVDKNGKATMMNAEVTGNITAKTLNATEGGTIGPFSISPSSLNSGQLKLTSEYINYNNNGIISFLGANYEYENGFSTSLFIENNSISTLGSIKNCATFKRGSNKVIIGDDDSIINVVAGYSRFKGLLFNVRTMSGGGILNYDDCIVICNATSKIDLYLPKYPRDGQVIWVTETTNVDCGVLGNGKKVFRNGTLYNWAQIRNNKSMLMLIYSGSYWIAHEYAGGTYNYGNN